MSSTPTTAPGELKGVKVKIFSVRADENFGTIRAGEEARSLSANEKLEQEIQTFLDQNTGIEWEIEKSVLIIYDAQE